MCDFYLKYKCTIYIVYLKVHRAKAILSHLVKCIAGEIVALKDNATNPEKRVRSRTISAGGSTARDRKMFSKAENSTTDYTEISSIPPLPDPSDSALITADTCCCRPSPLSLIVSHGPLINSSAKSALVSAHQPVPPSLCSFSLCVLTINRRSAARLQN